MVERSVPCVNAGDLRLLHAVAGGSCAAALGAVAHRSAGGTPPSLLALAMVVAVIGTARMLAGRVRWTFPRLLVAVVAAQPLIHLVFGAHGTASDHAAHHAHHGMDDAVAMHGAHAASIGAGWAMVITHAVLAAATAIVMRYGVRWLVAMPGCIRAVALFPRPTPLWPLMARTMVLAIASVPAAAAPSKVWNSRGPPG